MARRTLNTRKRQQDATYYGQVTSSGIVTRDASGRPTFNAAVGIKVRWEDKINQIVNDKGEDVVSTAIVYVDRAMVPGDVLWLGNVADANASARKNVGYKEVQKVDTHPHTGGLRGKTPEQVYIVYL